MILTLTMNPAIDKTAYLDVLEVGGLNRLEHVLQSPGGKGINVSKTIQSCNETSLATGFLAGSGGRYIRECLDELNISHEFVEVEGNTRVNLKVVTKDRQLTELNETGPVISVSNLEVLNETIWNNVKAKDVLVLSGSVPKGVASTFYKKMIQQAHTKKVKVILDADGPLFEEAIQAIPNIIKPNTYELCSYFNVDETSDRKELEQLARKLIQQGIELVVVSMGKDGALFVSEKQSIVVAGLKVECKSSVGAGDAMVAGLALALDKGYSLEHTIKLSVALSAGAVMSEGTSPASIEIVEELMKNVQLEELK